jgi:hypothetical protein
MSALLPIGLQSATRAEGTDQPCSGRHTVGDVQAAQLIVFVVAIIALLVALEIGLRREQRRR